MDLYDALGVDRDIPCEDVQKAYRKAAKGAHPDHGGSDERFQLVKLARDTLSDPQRRAHYDRTGEAEEKPVDNRHSAMLQALNYAIDYVQEKAHQGGMTDRVIAGDMVAAIIRATGEMTKQIDGGLRNIRKGIKHNEKLLGRFHTKDGGENVLERVIASRIAQHRISEASLAGKREALSDARAFLEGYTCDVKEAAEPPSPVLSAYDKLMTAVNQHQAHWT